MSVKSLLMPWVSQYWLSEARLGRRRARAERRRLREGLGHEVHYFHQVDDPYSALACTSLSALLDRYDITLHPHVVGPPGDAVAPERDKLIAYSRSDAERLARRHGLSFTDPGRQPSATAIERATHRLVAATEGRQFAQEAPDITRALWAQPQATDESVGDAAAAAATLQQASALRARLGHYLGATFFYAGEWYWGIDRLYHLERRLHSLGARRAGVSGVLFPPSADWSEPRPLRHTPDIDFYFSFRSPYSAIVAPRVFRLARLAGARVRLRFVLPMVMRGLPVPKAKRAYIALDAAREARTRGIDFGRINDPVGRPTERALSLVPLAERMGKGQEYVLSVMQGIWAEGVDAGSDAGLRRMAERAGLAWSAALAALGDQTWRSTAEANRQAMMELGLWGVPSFHVNGTAVWGQDRLWAVEDALTRASRAGEQSL